MMSNFQVHGNKFSLPNIEIKSGNFAYVFPGHIAELFVGSVFVSPRIAIVQYFQLV